MPGRKKQPSAREREAAANREQYASWRDVLQELLSYHQPRRAGKRWREKRNHLVCKLLDENPQMLRHEALKLANRLMRQK